MKIILNEYEWAENMIHNRDLGSKPVETLERVAKYYRANNYSKNDTRRLLENFLMQCDPGTSLSAWSERLDKLVKIADKYPPIILNGVSISSRELEAIERLESTQLKRLAFTLLCCCKYFDATKPNNNHWVNCSDKDLMQMANIVTSIRRQSAMFNELRKRGYIQFAKKIDNLNVRLLFADDEANDEKIFISDFRNLGYQYLKYYGGAYFECENCGIVVKERIGCGRKQKYCPTCALEIKTRQSINSVMRFRNPLPC